MKNSILDGKQIRAVYDLPEALEIRITGGVITLTDAETVQEVRRYRREARRLGLPEAETMDFIRYQIIENGVL